MYKAITAEIQQAFVRDSTGNVEPSARLRRSSRIYEKKKNRRVHKEV
jgi:hypothetical protein